MFILHNRVNYTFSPKDHKLHTVYIGWHGHSDRFNQIDLDLCPHSPERSRERVSREHASRRVIHMSVHAVIKRKSQRKCTSPNIQFCPRRTRQENVLRSIPSFNCPASTLVRTRPHSSTIMHTPPHSSALFHTHAHSSELITLAQRIGTPHDRDEW